MDIRSTASLVLNGAIAALTIYSWLHLMFGWGKSGELLADKGLRSMRYFTVLSNLFSGIVSLLCIAAYLMQVAMLPVWLLALKLIAATAVMLTFSVVILVLVPAYDLRSMYRGSNFWMHLVLPLLAAFDCCFLVPVGLLPWQSSFLALIPVVLYAMFYLYGIVHHGVEDNGVLYDFYHFLRWGEDKIAIVAIVALASTGAIALILRGASSLLCI